MTEMEQKTLMPPHGGVNDVLDHEDEQDEQETIYTNLDPRFREYLLVSCMQYSDRFYRILHALDKSKHLMDPLITAFGVGLRDVGIYRENYRNKINWAFYLTRDIITQSNSQEVGRMTLIDFVQLLTKVPETKIFLKDIYESQEVILREFGDKRLVRIPAVLLYRRALLSSGVDFVSMFKRQLQTNNFEVKDINEIAANNQENELKQADAIFIIFDEVMNQIFDETKPYTPEQGEPDFRHLGRLLYHEFLVNDCRNDRIYLFVTPSLNAVLQDTFKFQWLLRENNLNFANDREVLNRPHVNRVRTYIRPLVIPNVVEYLNDPDNIETQNIDNHLGRIYNQNRPLRNLRRTGGHP